MVSRCYSVLVIGNACENDDNCSSEGTFCNNGTCVCGNWYLDPVTHDGMCVSGT